MKGCRDLSDEEYRSLMDYFTENDQLRDKTIFAIQGWAGYRISEVLSLRVRDLFHVKQDGLELKNCIYVKPKNMKGKKRPRKMWIHDRLAETLVEYGQALYRQDGFSVEWYMFQSRKGDNKAISYVQAWRILKEAFEELGIRENVATHSLRKTYADRVYKSTGKDIIATMELMGHSSPDVTMAYLSVDEEKLEQAVLNQ